FWAVASGRIYWRPRYLLPVCAATAVHLGVGVAWLASRSRLLAALALSAVLAVNVGGTWSRLRSGREVAEPYERLVRSLEAKQIRTGYADFSISAPVTMFTSERIVFSSRLGPTPSYESDRHTRKVAQEGPDAYVLRADDDPERFAAVLAALGVTYKQDVDPFPIFYGFSRRVRLEEGAGVRGEEGAEPRPGRGRLPAGGRLDELAVPGEHGVPAVEVADVAPPVLAQRLPQIPVVEQETERLHELVGVLIVEAGVGPAAVVLQD